MSDDQAAKAAAEAANSPIVGEIADTPTIFIDGAQGISVTNAVAKINLYQVIQDVREEEAPPRRIIVARLAMSVQTLAQLTVWLSEHVKLEAQKDE